MKKIPIVAILMMMSVSPLFAVHTILRNASNLTSGILPNERIDDSSVTQRGGTPLLVDGTGVLFSSHISGGFSGIVGFETVFPTNTQRGAFLLNGVKVVFASNTADDVMRNGGGVVSSTNVENNTFLSQGLNVLKSTNATTGAAGGFVENAANNIDASTQIAPRSVGATRILQNTITGVEIASGAIGNAQIGAGAGSLHASTTTTASNLSATGVATGTLRADLALVGVATGTIRTDLALVGVATGTIRTDLDAKKVITNYTLTVGTRGAVGVDTTVENLAQWNMVLSSVGLGGLSSPSFFDFNEMPNSSAAATIFFKNGLYPLSGSTWPFGLTAIFDSTAVIFNNGGTGSELARVYGKMITPKFFGNDVVWTGNMVKMSSFSQIISPYFYGMTNQSTTGGLLGSILLMDSAVRARLEDAEFEYAKPVGGINEYGDRANLIVNRSSSCYVSIKSWTGFAGNNTHTSVSIRGSSNTYLSGNWYKMGGNGVIIGNGSVDTHFDNFFYEQTRTGGDNSAIQIAAQAGFNFDTGTGTVISNGRVVMKTAGGAGVMITIGGAVSGQKAYAVTMQNVQGFSRDNVGGGFLTINARALNTVLIGVTSRGFSTGLADTGVGTVKTGVYKDGVAQ